MYCAYVNASYTIFIYSSKAGVVLSKAEEEKVYVSHGKGTHPDTCVEECRLVLCGHVQSYTNVLVTPSGFSVQRLTRGPCYCPRQ